MGRITVHRSSGAPDVVGAAHGAAFGTEIKSYLETRVELSLAGTDLDRGGVVAIAEAMLDAHRDYDAELFAEMIAMADAAGITPAEAVIVGGYTDFIDTVRALASGTAVEDACTAVVTPDATSGGNGFLAQTWDMNATATPHVFLLDVQPDDSPRALVFTTHGTLGQIGMNEAGLAIGINNLTMADGAIGVTWPFVVRRVLKQRSFDSALDAVLDAPLAGGHNFLLLDEQGRGASIEATSTQSSVVELDGEPLIHTNHCQGSATRAVEAARPLALEENSARRLHDATRLVGARLEHTADSMIGILRDESSISRRPEPPYDYESSGAVVMRPGTLEMWACWGIPSENPFERFSLA